MQVSKETITPKKAMEWLKRNIHNRPLSQAHVGRLAGAMKSGVWKMNGDTIRFNGNGDLIDGQHRLNACVQSGVSFDSYVVKGLPHEAFDTIDQGRKRSCGDILSRRGEKHYNTVAAALRIVHEYRTTGVITNGAKGFRGDELVACLEENPSVRECSDFAVNNKAKLIAPSLVAALLFLFREQDAGLADKFWKDVLTGEGLTSGMPQYRLRERLIDNSTSLGKMRTTQLSALSIKAWNFVRAKKSIKALVWAEREEFPVIK